MAEGPELIVNGTFDTDFTGWETFINSTGAFVRRFAPDANMEIKPGIIFIPPTPPTQVPGTSIAANPFSVTVSTSYKLRFDVDTRDGPAPSLNIGGVASTAVDGPLTWVTQIAISSLGSKSIDWTSPGSGTTLRVKHAMQGLGTGLTRTDNWSVREQNVVADFRPIIMFY